MQTCEAFPTIGSRIRHILHLAPIAARDMRLLLMLYWKVFDGADIPDSAIASVVMKGTRPDNIMRICRRVLAKEEESP